VSGRVLAQEKRSGKNEANNRQPFFHEKSYNLTELQPTRIIGCCSAATRISLFYIRPPLAGEKARYRIEAESTPALEGHFQKLV
jgi:hypothetical protein